jgi:hypothetical protein
MVPLIRLQSTCFIYDTTSSGEAKRMWRQNIKEEWESSMCLLWVRRKFNN